MKIRTLTVRIFQSLLAAFAGLLFASSASAQTTTPYSNSTDSATNGINDSTTPCSNRFTRTFNVSVTGTITEIEIGVLMAHTYRGDLLMYLVEPGGTRIQLTTGSGGGADNFNVLFDDDGPNSITGHTSADTAGPGTVVPTYEETFSPTSSLSGFDGNSPTGVWTLEICDQFGGDSGTFYQADLFVTTGTVTPPSGPADNPSVGTVINSYAKVNGISGSTLSVSTTAGFTAGGRGLLIQMQGSNVTTSDTSTHGDITSYNSAGRFEYVEIISVGGGSMTLSSPTSVPFNTAGSVQIVSVPVYNSTTIVGTIVPQPWNGNTGGVVALDDIGTLSLTGNIDSTGHGFRGGALATTIPYDSCASDQTNYTGVVQGGTGNKGEGIIANSTTHAARRGHRANGGGGGNITDAGGGGGSNVGFGGIGGRRLDLCDNTSNPVGGLGGQSLDYSPNNRLFLGGGGGSGSEISQAATGGDRAGGGIIMVRAQSIVGMGGQFIAQGLNAAADNNNGSDGGGAAGSIAISVTGSLTGSPVTDVSGGDGGDEANGSYAHGTGGGGGGGAIRLFGTTCASVSPVFSGGNAGTSVLGSNVGDPNWGAGPGGQGNCQGNFPEIGVVGTTVSVAKISSIISDPVNGSSNPKAIPGAVVEYNFSVGNTGGNSADNNSLVLTDNFPSDLTMCVADFGGGGPFIFTDGSPASGLTYSFTSLSSTTDSLEFSNDSGATWTYAPAADANGCDNAITSFRVTPSGSFAASSSFTLRARFLID